MVSDNNDHAKLPDELLVEIFLQSSAESLVRAKYVCKQWYNIIQNHNFVISHLQYQKSHNKGHLLLQYFKKDPEEYSFALFDDDNIQSNTYQDIDHLKLPWFHLHIAGYVNGIYCLYNRRERIVLWNPAIKESKTLPIPHPHFFPHLYVYRGHIGFGIDPSTNDYKLILFRNFQNESDLHSIKYVTLYNLTTNTWRLLTDCNFHLVEWSINRNENSSFLNGSCHWWTKSGMVIAFDMTEERFRQMPAPNHSHSVPPSGSMTIYDNKLAVMHKFEYYVDVWVMVEEGVWIKKFSITSVPTHHFCVIGLWMNEGLFLALDDYSTESSQMYLCRPNNKEMVAVGPKGKPLCFQTSMHYESLVPVGNGTKHKGKLASLSTISGFLNKSVNPYLYLYTEKNDFSSGDDEHDGDIVEGEGDCR